MHPTKTNRRLTYLHFRNLQCRPLLRLRLLPYISVTTHKTRLLTPWRLRRKESPDASKISLNNLSGSSGMIPDTLMIVRPSKRSSDVTIFVETRTLQDSRLSASYLSHEIVIELDIHVWRTIVTTIRKGLCFKFRLLAQGQNKFPILRFVWT
jgi:hypothetical protein